MKLLTSLTEQFKLLEAAPREYAAHARELIDHLTDGPVKFMDRKRGANFDVTNLYQIYAKPTDAEADRIEVRAELVKLLKSASSKKLGITNVKAYDRSPNSGRFPSVSVSYKGGSFEFVIAIGGNTGEKFEQELVPRLNKFITNLQADPDTKDPLARAAFAALAEVDPCFKLSNIQAVRPRSGSTQIEAGMTPAEIGQVTADFIITLKRASGGSKDKYISLKHSTGTTLRKMGVFNAFNDDYTANTTSANWKTWFAAFDLNLTKVTQGFNDYKNKEKSDFEDVDAVNKKVRPGSAIYKAMVKLWGQDYYYLRESGQTFTAMKVDEDYLKDVLLKNLTVTQVFYPYWRSEQECRKQISIYLTSDGQKYRIQARNTAGGIVPKELQLSLS